MRNFYAAFALFVLSTPAIAVEPAHAPNGALAPIVSGHPPPAMPPAAQDEQVVVTGKVLETMNAANYTYVRVAANDGELWAAGPQTTVAVGDTVSFSRGMEMRNFRSDKLDRTFDSIAFVNAITVGAPASAPGTAQPGRTDPHGAIKSTDAAGVDLSGIKRAEGGMTIAEIFAQKDALAGKEVVLRAKVVKVNRGIMGHNWLHLRDGTSTANGANDLTITSNGAAEVGATVLVRGTVAVNKDFGFGYRYDVLLEDAAITAE